MMKMILSILIAVALATPFVASAADSTAVAGKNPCLLNSANCDASMQSDSIQQKITKYENELQKGTSVYTADELRLLASKLNGYQLFSTALLYN